jgi:hypothetical protein
LQSSIKSKTFVKLAIVNICDANELLHKDRLIFYVLHYWFQGRQELLLVVNLKIEYRNDVKDNYCH